MPPKVITITNQKGGTGKSTLTALLGYELASRGYNILLLDLDPQAHLSSFFIPVKELEYITDGVIQMATGEEFKIRKVNLNTKGKLDIIPSGLNYIVAVYRGRLPLTYPFAIYDRISKEPFINKSYDYILCDTAPELFAPTLWGLYAADYILIPTNNEELSFAGIKLLIKEVLPDVIMHSRKDLKVLGIVLVNVVKRIRQDSLNQLSQYFTKYLNQLPSTIKDLFYKKPIFDTVVYRYQELRDLIYTPRRKGMPLDRLVRRSKNLQQNLSNLSDELLKRIQDLSKSIISGIIK